MNRSSSPKTYAGLNNDLNGGMTMIGRIIRDAWIFEILPETETCEGWELSRIDVIHHQVNDEWDKYSCMVSNLPEDLRERHKRIHDQAIKIAKEKGWDPEQVAMDMD